MNQEACPTPQELSSFACGSLSTEQVDSIVEHLENCPVCEAVYSRLESRPDSMQDKLRAPAPEDEFAKEPGCEQVVNRIDKIGLEALLNSRASTGNRCEEEDLPRTLGQYQLLEKLGAGGMGKVYRAMHLRLHRIVALKTLPADQFQNQNALARFEQEMYAVGQLNHPNVVVAHDAGQVEGQPYLVMELVEGVDLSDLLRATGQLEVADASELIRQAAEGLHHAHKLGLIHRDIKPSNLMLGRIGEEELRLKILDLGLARLSQSHTSTRPLTSVGQPMGTLDFMAPEQGEDSHQVDSRADIYSLGCTFYKLLTGETPFPRSRYVTPVKLLMALATETPTPIRDKRELPEPLARLIDRMLSRNPADRPDAAEVAQALIPFSTNSNLTDLFNRVSTVPLSDLETVLPQPNPPPTVDDLEPVTQSSSNTRSWNFLLWLLLLICVLGGTVLAGIVLLLPGKHGTIRIESEDPSLIVTVDGEDRYLVKGKTSTFELITGKHKLFIKTDGKVIQTNDFTVARGKTTQLRITLIPGNILRVLDGNKVVHEEHLAQPAASPLKYVAGDPVTVLLRITKEGDVWWYTQEKNGKVTKRGLAAKKTPTNSWNYQAVVNAGHHLLLAVNDEGTLFQIQTHLKKGFLEFELPAFHSHGWKGHDRFVSDGNRSLLAVRNVSHLYWWVYSVTEKGKLTIKTDQFVGPGWHKIRKILPQRDQFLYFIQDEKLFRFPYEMDDANIARTNSVETEQVGARVWNDDHVVPGPGRSLFVVNQNGELLYFKTPAAEPVIASSDWKSTQHLVCMEITRRKANDEN